MTSMVQKCEMTSKIYFSAIHAIAMIMMLNAILQRRRRRKKCLTFWEHNFNLSSRTNFWPIKLLQQFCSDVEIKLNLRPADFERERHGFERQLVCSVEKYCLIVKLLGGASGTVH